MSAHTPGPWERNHTTIYALEHHGWRKGKEEFRNRFSIQVIPGPAIPPEEIQANARLIEAAPDGYEAAKEALAWIWDPDADANDEFERIAAEFYRETGYLRPGKDAPFRANADPNYDAKRAAEWEWWRTSRARKVRAALEAFVAKVEGQ